MSPISLKSGFLSSKRALKREYWVSLRRDWPASPRHCWAVCWMIRRVLIPRRRCSFPCSCYTVFLPGFLSSTWMKSWSYRQRSTASNLTASLTVPQRHRHRRNQHNNSCKLLTDRDPGNGTKREADFPSLYGWRRLYNTLNISRKRSKLRGDLDCLLCSQQRWSSSSTVNRKEGGWSNAPSLDIKGTATSLHKYV